MIRDITIGQYYPADSVLHSFQSSCEIYVQGTEGNRNASYDHSGI